MIEEQYHDLEVWYPYFRLQEARMVPVLVGTGTARTYLGKFGYPANAEASVEDERGSGFDAVLVPGGFAPDFLRRSARAVAFLREADEAGRVIASICHGAWMVISAGVIRGRRMTCFSAIKDDVINGGAEYVDEEVVVDGTLISSRKPEDLPAFTLQLVTALSEGGGSKSSARRG